MPFASDKQRRYIYAKAGEGEPWAKKFVKDAHGEVKKKANRSKRPMPYGK